MDLEHIKKKIINVRGQQMILDRDVADLYNVEIKRINESARKYRDKFPEGYIFQLTAEEWDELKLKDSSLLPTGRGRHPKFIPKAFSEKAVYMLATIIKSKISANTTINIVETFSKTRQLAELINEIGKTENIISRKVLLKKSNVLVKDIFNDKFHQIDPGTAVKLNISVLKQKQTVKRECKKD